VANNYQLVKEIFKTREMSRSILFVLLLCFTFPRFDEFMYYFKTGPEVGFSQMTYGLLTLFGAMALILGIYVYQRFFKNMEPRTIMGCAFSLIMLASFVDMCFVLRWNLILGVPDLAWVLCTSTALGTLIFAFLILPPGILFVKLTPSHVEATTYALTSSITAAIYPMSKLLGVLINSLTWNVTFEDMSDLYKLYIV
jgi:hypothetical protein